MILKILVKLNRICAWLLIPLILLFYISGFAITGEYGLNEILDPNKALRMHSILAMPTLVCFLAHVGISVFFAIKRWIKKNR